MATHCFSVKVLAEFDEDTQASPPFAGGLWTGKQNEPLCVSSHSGSRVCLSQQFYLPVSLSGSVFTHVAPLHIGRRRSRLRGFLAQPVFG
jgi:hypothetical protein